jgi:zinc/manganese transport system permease protein
MSQILAVLGRPLLACLMMIAILGYLGIHVLKREVIFIDIALAQTAAVGAIGAHLAFGAHGDSPLSYACAFGAVLLAAAFYSVVRRRVTQISLEAVIGVTYAIAAAAALFLVGIAPGGHVHVHEMLAGSILWTGWKDLLWCALAFAGVGVCLLIFRRPLGRISDGYESARGEGVNVVLWDFLFYALLGVVITLAVRLAGVVVVFALLIIPATASALFSSRWGGRLLAAWTLGAAACTGGLLFAYSLDFSVGPAVALFLGVVLVLTACGRSLVSSARGPERGSLPERAGAEEES